MVQIRAGLALSLSLAALPSLAQEVASGDAPLSAIPWLTESLNAPIAPPRPAEPAVTDDAGIETISTSTIGGTVPDAVGLLPTSISGLAPDLWGPATAAELATAVSRPVADMVPALQEIRERLLVAELDPPIDADASGTFFAARVDALLATGALDQAQALLERAGPMTPQLFPRYFDVALLTGAEQRACEQLQATPALNPTYPVRVFCMARTGDWNGAVLTLTSANALGLVSEFEYALLARFLDPELFAGEELPPRPAQVTPLVFRLLDAVDDPLPTTDLPRAFAFTDLDNTRGWKAQLEAAERLARAGAIDPARLIALYTYQKPAASGGVWDRAAALQLLEATLDDPARLSPALVRAWDLMEDAGLLPVLSTFINGRIAPEGLSDPARVIAGKLAMLGPGYEAWALDHAPETADERIYAAIARGKGDATGRTTKEEAVLAAFTSRGTPDRLASLIEAGRKGEAILRALELITSGAAGNPGELTDGLVTLRLLGLESTARRAGLQVLILDTRG